MEALMATFVEWFDPAVLGPQVLDLAAKWTGRIVAALLIFIVGRWIAAKIADVVALATERAHVEATLTRFLRSVIYMALLIMVIFTAVGPLGVEPTSFLAILGAAGLAVGLALKDSLSNFSSGVMLVFFRPFKVGDYVEAAGVAGHVETISIFNTVLKTVDNCLVIVPNSMIYAGAITNFSALPTRRIDLVIGVSYGDNIIRAKEIMQSVLDAHERVLEYPASQILMLDLAESSVNYAVRPWVANADYWTVRGEVLEQIKQALEENGLSIPFPQRDVHLIGQA